jgi:lipopolysaccharide transport system permease protein
MESWRERSDLSATGSGSPSFEADRREAVRSPKSLIGQSPSTISFRYYADLIVHLVKRDFILRYKGSALGVLWILLVPLMQLLTLVFVFDKVVPLNIDSYPAFVFCGLLPWTWFSSSLSTAAGLFVSNRDLVRRPNFPPLILIIVNTCSNLLLYLLVLPLVVILLLVYNHSFNWTLFLLPVLILIESILIQGLSVIIATCNVFYRDVQQITAVILTLLFYITPVFYKPQQVNPRYALLFKLNPMASLVKAYRDVLFYAQPPEFSVLLLTCAITLLITALGYWFYNRQISNVIDVL